jgi:hypothetical protein
VFVRGDETAGAPLGVVAGIATAERLTEMVGQVSDRALSVVLGTILARPDFGPDNARLAIVKTLGSLPGEEPVLALQAYDRSLPDDEERESRTEARQILEGRRQGQEQPK